MSVLLEEVLLNQLRTLIGFKTVASDKKALNSCFDYLENFLRSNNMSVLRHNSNGFPSIYAATTNTKRTKVLLQSHIDVVPAEKKLLKLVDKSGKLYGRGVYDMKFAAACYLTLVQSIKDELHNYDFALMLSGDEEIGGENGVGYLLDQGYEADVCVLPDGGNNWQIETTANGLWMIRLSSTGECAHGSRPWEGQNAITNLIYGLEEILELFGEMKRDKSTLTLSQIEGGKAINQVPDCAWATLDMRFINEKEFTHYKQAVEKIAKNFNLTIKTEYVVKNRKIRLDHPEIKKFIAIAQNRHNEPIKETHSLGASDARYFAAKNIPTIITRPDGGGAHGNNEWIDKAGLIRFYDVLFDYVKVVAST